MNLSQRLFDVLRAQLGNLRQGPILDRAQRHWRHVHANWQATREAYEQGRRGESSGRAGADPRTRSAGRQDPDLARWYANLEVPYGSDLETVTRAWKRLMARYHPDRHASDPAKQHNATELVKGLNHAYQQLRRRLESQPGGRPGAR